MSASQHPAVYVESIILSQHQYKGSLSPAVVCIPAWGAKDCGWEGTHLRERDSKILDDTARRGIDAGLPVIS